MDQLREGQTPGGRTTWERGLTAHPEQVGAYRLEEVLGQGGMGVVYRAVHGDTGALAAVKTVRAGAEGVIAAIRREVHALERLSHPGVVAILDHGLHEGLPWYAMDLLEGRTLRDVEAELWGEAPRSPATRADRKGASGGDSSIAAAAPEEALQLLLELFRRLCLTLAYLHGEGVVHRDLKPANVFIGADGAPVLVDFGIVSRFTGARTRESLELPGGFMGTAGFAAPEQIRGELLDPRVDLYAIGVMLFEAVTGRMPFTGSEASVLYSHLFKPPPRARELAPWLPEALDELIDRLLAKQPRDRPGYASDVAAALAQLLGRAPGAPEARVRPYLYRPAFSGRRHQLEALELHIEGVVKGRGALVAVAGESGVGKTRLAMEAALAGVARECLVITGECSPVGSEGGGLEGARGAPLHPLRPLLQLISDRYRDKPLSRVEKVLGARGKVLAAYEPALATLPGQANHPAPAPLPAPAARRRVITYLLDVIGAVAIESPVVLILDDLQWADELTLSFLQALTPEFLGERRVLVFGLYRSDHEGAELRRALGAHGAPIELGGLDGGTVAEMAAAMLALPAPPAGLVDFLAVQSRGNPFFVGELLRAAVTEGVFARGRDGSWQLSGSAAEVSELIPLPSSVEGLVRRRLERLGGPGTVLLELGAVFGRELELGQLLRLAGLPEEATFDGLAELTRGAILEDLGQGRLRFAHDKLRELAYEALPEERRRALHQQVARFLEAEQPKAPVPEAQHAVLAHHYRRGGVDERTLFHLEKAGRHALKTGAYREASGFLTEALEVAKRVPGVGALERARLERLAADALYSSGRIGEAKMRAERALEGLGRPFRESTLQRSLGAHLARRAAARLIRREPSIDRTDPTFAELAATYFLLVHISYHDGDSEAFIRANLAMLDLTERAAPTRELAEANAVVALLLGMAKMLPLAERYARRAEQAVDEVGDAATAVSVRTVLGVYRGGLGRWDELERAADTVGRLAEEIGDRRRWEECVSLAALAAFHRGQLDEAERRWKSVEASAARVGGANPAVWALAGQAEVSLRRDPAVTPELEALLARAAALLEAEPLGPAEEIRVRGLEALVAWRRGRAEEALDAVRRTLKLIEGLSSPPPFYCLCGYEALATVTVEALARMPSAGAEAEAKRAVRALERYAKVYPVGRPRAELAAGHLERALGRGGKAPKRYREALARAEALEMRSEAEEARRALG